MAENAGCAVGMCIFVAVDGSKYCKHHRSSMEAYDRKYEKPQYSVASELEADEWDAEFRKMEREAGR